MQLLLQVLNTEPGGEAVKPAIKANILAPTSGDDVFAALVEDGETVDVDLSEIVEAEVGKDQEPKKALVQSDPQGRVLLSPDVKTAKATVVERSDGAKPVPPAEPTSPTLPTLPIKSAALDIQDAATVVPKSDKPVSPEAVTKVPELSRTERVDRPDKIRAAPPPEAKKQTLKAPVTQSVADDAVVKAPAKQKDPEKALQALDYGKRPEPPKAPLVKTRTAGEDIPRVLPPDQAQEAPKPKTEIALRPLVNTESAGRIAPPDKSPPRDAKVSPITVQPSTPVVSKPVPTQEKPVSVRPVETTAATVPNAPVPRVLPGADKPSPVRETRSARREDVAEVTITKPAEPSGTPATSNESRIVAQTSMPITSALQSTHDLLGQSARFGPEAAVLRDEGVVQVSAVETSEARRQPEMSAPRMEAPARPVITQLVQAAKSAIDGMIEVKLSPEELGRVRLAMTSGESGMTVLVTAERSETLDLIRRNIDLFAADLTEQGFSDLSFSFGQEGTDNPQSDKGAHPNEDASSQIHNFVADHQVAGARLTDGRLDIRL